MNELQVQNAAEVAVTNDYKKIAADYLKSMGMRLPDKYAAQFIDVAQAYGLNPIKREIYAVGYGDNWNVITGYEVYLKRAERTGKLDGWKCTVDGQGNSMRATITIYRKDWTHEFCHTVLFGECAQRKKDGNLNGMWAKMPSFMLKKVAIAQGFRLCFSDELGGMPYTGDELPEQEKGAEKTDKAVNPARKAAVNFDEVRRAAENVADGTAETGAEFSDDYDCVVALESILTDENKAYFSESNWTRAQRTLADGTPEQIKAVYEWASKEIELKKARA